MATQSGDVVKPRVVILGGCGFVGRNVLTHLIENDLISHARVVDKVPPQTAWLNPKHADIFGDPKVEFRSANLINPVSCQNALAPDEGNSSWDYVINCACETKPGQTDPVYQEGILKLSINCATESAKLNVKRFIELSAGAMFSDEKVAHKENGPLEPWTYVSRWKAKVEDELRNIPNLNYTIIRPGIIYGLGDRRGLTPRLLIGAVYKHLGETMKLLWSAKLLLNTVHVDDVARAIWHLCNLEQAKSEIYNVVDNGNTTQGKISDLVAEIFGINVDYWGAMMSTIAKTDMSNLVDEVNDKHMAPWAEMCQIDNIQNTPLSPYMDEELLLCKQLYLDGSKLRISGFDLNMPEVTKDVLIEMLRDFSTMAVFPHSLI